MSDLTGTAEMRLALHLAKKNALTVAEIFEQCDQVSSATVVAAFMAKEVKEGRAIRTGEPGKFRYQLSDAGRKALTTKADRDLSEDADLGGGKRITSVKQLVDKQKSAQRQIPPAAPDKTPKAAPNLEPIKNVVEKVSGSPAERDSSKKVSIKLSNPSAAIDPRVDTNAPTNAGALIELLRNCQPGNIDREAQAESTQRLAAAVICFWPEPLATVPLELVALVRENLSHWLPEA